MDPTVSPTVIVGAITAVGGVVSLVGTLLIKTMNKSNDNQKQLMDFALKIHQSDKGNPPVAANGGNHAVTHLMLQQMEKRDDMILDGQKETNKKLGEIAGHQEDRNDVLEGTTAVIRGVQELLTKLEEERFCPLLKEQEERLKKEQERYEDRPGSHEL